MTGAVRDLADRLEIIELTHRYARAMDERCWDVMERLFTENAEANLDERFQLKGGAAIVGTIRSLIEKCGTTHHTMSNHEVALAGDAASLRLCCRAFHRGRGERRAQTLEVLVTYTAELVRTAEGWRVRSWHERCSDAIGDMKSFFDLQEPNP